MFKAHKNLVTFLACACLLTFLTAGFLHDVIPHHHGAVDNHGNDADSAIWATLHSAVQHDQKKPLIVLAQSFLMILASILSVSIFKVIIPAQSPELLALDPYAGTMLRRGILPHRAFR